MIKTKAKFTILTMIAQSLDLLTTVVGIKYFDFREINPFMANFGVAGIALIKILAMALMFLIMSEMIRAHEDIKPIVYKAVFYISLSPALWNLLNFVAEFTL